MEEGCSKRTFKKHPASCTCRLSLSLWVVQPLTSIRFTFLESAQDHPPVQGLCVPEQRKAILHRCLYMTSRSPPGAVLGCAEEALN